MKRVIITPPDLAPAALDELKDWLAITASTEDGFLSGLLRASLETCEAFTGQVPLEASCEEVHPADSTWRGLATRPILAVTGIDGIPGTGPRFALAGEDYMVDLDAAGGAHFRLLRQTGAERIAVRFLAGIAPDWASLSEGLRHGIVRLAADAYRNRNGEPVGSSPPAAVAALWRPWRRMRLT